jgi:tRNA(His) 5'-end guanylyltransferase
MQEAAKAMAKEMQGAHLAYCQSDEVSFLLTDYEKIDTEAWFNKNVQKIASISSALMTYYFGEACRTSGLVFHCPALFDARVFVLPVEEVCNYFIWRQKDAIRNSIQGLGQAMLGHKKIQGLTNNEVQELLFQEKGINWSSIPTLQKKGFCVYKMRYEGPNEWEQWILDKEIPEFTQDRNYIERFV